MPRILRTAAALALVSLLAFPAQAAVLYDPCFGIVHIRTGIEDGSDAYAGIPDDCIHRDPLISSPVGNPVGAPEDEVLDIMTNVVYRQEGGILRPVGYGQPAQGYAVVHAYPKQGTPLPTTMDTNGPCQAEHYCVSFNVALKGPHQVDVVAVYKDGCNGATENIFHADSPGSGMPVTMHQRRIMPPMPSHCVATSVVVLLIIDGMNDVEGVYYGASATAF